MNKETINYDDVDYELNLDDMTVTIDFNIDGWDHFYGATPFDQLVALAENSNDILADGICDALLEKGYSLNYTIEHKLQYISDSIFQITFNIVKSQE